MKKILLVIFCGGFFAAVASAYFFFPATAKNVLKSAAAVAVKSWDDTFGTADGYLTTEITGDEFNGAASDTVENAAGENADGLETINQIDAHEVNEAPPAAPLKKKATVARAATTTGVDHVDDAVVNDAVLDQTTDEVRSPTSPLTPLPACSFAASLNQNPTHAVIVNEIAWMGSVPLAGETSAKAGNREWMELKNISGSAVDISGWRLADASQKIDIVFEKGTKIPAGGFYLLERGSASGTLPGVHEDMGYSGALVNDGGSLILFDSKCGVVDRLDAPGGWPGGDNVSKKTLERDRAGFGWHTSVSPGGTPRVENSVPPPPVTLTHIVNIAMAATTSTSASDTSTGDEAAFTATTTATTTTTTTIATTTITTTTTETTTTITTTSTTSTVQCITEATSTPTPTVTTVTSSTLVIAEIQIAGAASSDDFVKIFNSTAAAVDVGGWKLRKKSKSGADYSLRVFPPDSSVPAGGYFIWANATDGFGDAMQANVTSTETLAADNSVALFDAAGVLIDAVAWGEGTNQYVEGVPFPTNPEPNQVLKRRYVDNAIVDANDNATDFAL